ncbi:Rv3235 family protein [Gordonia zhaorongruii]|uniref:Rv3235 family protein n=1 Tax=Gordonia zhaorongruii TaxID=2597659 RepID=UPI001C91CEE8|nr:Rv3235 family protein [Gordonia zhaorongruii]
MSTVIFATPKSAIASSGAPTTGTSAPPLESARAARTAAVGTLQRVFEVLDGRRPCEHLATVTSPDVFAQLTMVLQRREAGPGRAGGPGTTARLRRVHLQMASPRQADCFGTVERASRVRAVVGRLELRPVRLPGRRRFPELRWVLIEFGII